MTVALAPSDVERFRALVAQRLGLYFDDTKIDYLAGVARQRMEASRSDRVEPYLRQIAANDPAEIGALATQLTVGETYFFRYWDHFRAFTEVVIPECVKARGQVRQLRILSAGCASGEEAYSIAMLLREHLPDATSYDLAIVGVDINPVVVDKARRGRYAAWSLRETSPYLKARYFREDGREFELDDSIRAMVSFDRQNLLDETGTLRGAGEFDVVFCRNVTMYFTPEVTRSIIDRIRRALTPRGFLFLGHAETLRGVSHGFHLRHTHETFYYQRREGDAVSHLPSTPTDGATRDAWVSDLPLASDAPWVDVIQRASDRIARLVATSPSVASLPTFSAPAVDLSAAVEMMRDERFAEALDLLHRLPAASRADLDAQLLRAVLLTNSGELARAEQVCEQLLSVDDLNAGAHYLMALCREHAGDAEGALEHDLSATYLDPGFMMPHLHVGLLAKRAGDLERARVALRQALMLVSGEDASRILLFGGGFSREALAALCQSELRACRGES